VNYGLKEKLKKKYEKKEKSAAGAGNTTEVNNSALSK
jgi:hypothetical protein